jgi:hypothetical protein
VIGAEEGDEVEFRDDDGRGRKALIERIDRSFLIDSDTTFQRLC